MRKLLLVLVSVFVSTAVFGYDEVCRYESESTDLQTRLSISLEYKPVKGLTLSWSEEARFNDFSTQFDRLYSSLGLSYKAHENFSFGGSYEFQVVHKPTKPEAERFQLRHRAKLYVQPSVKFDRFSLSLRGMGQMTYRMDEYNPLQNVNPAWEFRTRLKLSYSFFSKPVKPYISVEMYNPLNKVEYAEHWVSALHYRAGVEWRIDAVNTLDFFYMFEHGMEDDVDVKPNKNRVEVTREFEYIHVIGISYNLGL